MTDLAEESHLKKTQTPHRHSRELDARLLREYAAEPTPAKLERLVERFRGLSRSLAQRYRGGNEPFDDLIQVADMGLVKAIQGYDPDLGKAFAGYAVPTILGELRRHFRDRVWNLRLPRSLQEATMAVDAATDRMTEELGRRPTVAEIAERTDLDEEAVAEALVAREARWTISTEAPVGGGDDDQPIVHGDLIGIEEAGYDRVEANYAVSTVDLEERERVVLDLRFDAGMTQSEIGDQLGVSQMQVSRLSRRALKKLLAATRGEDQENAEKAVA